MAHYKLAAILLLASSAFAPTNAFVLPSSKPVAFSTTTRSGLSTTTTTIRGPSSLYSSAAEEEEWYPKDPAYTTPQLLSSLWLLIVQGCGMTKGESMSVDFPEMEETFTPNYLNRLLGHLDVCKDVCDDFGVNTILTPRVVKKMGRDTVVGFTVKSFKNPDSLGTLSSDGSFEFAPDPFWDDDDDWDRIAQSAAEEDAEDALEREEAGFENLPEIENRIPDDDDEMIDITKAWVDKIMSDMGVCPFTNGPEKAGLPMGQVFYCVERGTTMEKMYLAYWKEAVRIEQNKEEDVSTTLLIAPEFCIDNVETFEHFSDSLTQPLESLEIEKLLQLVFFHPEWTFRDGGARVGITAAANYARRSPWPMINILRTSQVRTAQKGIPTGLVYQQNEKSLNSVGAANLEKMLRKRDWSEIADLKVDRKDIDALRVARDLQNTGVVTQKDTSFANDSTPAANKVDAAQIEGGDMMNVVKQALEKRLNGGKGGNPVALNGAETSAAMMASDFLLGQLGKLEAQTTEEKEGEMKKKEAMKYFDEGEFVQGEVSESDEMDVLFGGGGIPMTDDDDDSSSGVDPRSFY